MPHFDLSALDLFLSFSRGQASLDLLLGHPAYLAISHHSRLFGEGFTRQDVLSALQGLDTPFFGLQGLDANLPRIIDLATVIRSHASAWQETLQAELSRLFPHEMLDIPIYPVIGYDMGIGLDGCACLNLNVPSYLENPDEFLFYSLHECVHVLYERSHPLAPLAEVNSPEEWRSYFNLWLQNEGYAVYAPLGLRERRNALAVRDYDVLFDPARLEAHRRAFFETLRRLDQEPPLSRQDYLEYCFGSQRLTYRLGCKLIRRIEKVHGLEAVRDAFYLDGDAFFERYRALLEED